MAEWKTFFKELKKYLSEEFKRRYYKNVVYVATGEKENEEFLELFRFHKDMVEQLTGNKRLVRIRHDIIGYACKVIFCNCTWYMPSLKACKRLGYKVYTVKCIDRNDALLFLDSIKNGIETVTIEMNHNAM